VPAPFQYASREAQQQIGTRLGRDSNAYDEAMPDEETPDRVGAPDAPLPRIVLRDLRDAGGVRHLQATRQPDGGILIEGQDLGSGVEQAFGAGLTEYEWAWDIEADAVPAVIVALDGREGDDPLRLLAAWSSAHGGLDPGSHLQDAAVPIKFWSRIGD